jgi:hypothetical protein
VKVEGMVAGARVGERVEGARVGERVEGAREAVVREPAAR